MVKQTMVHLTEELIEQADKAALRRQMSRSALIREALHQFLAGGIEADLDRQLVEGYTRIPQGTPDEWGDPAADVLTSTQRLHARLDAEERRQGMEW